MEKGRYKLVPKIVHIDAVQGVEEQGHWEVIKEYPNGSKDVYWKIDVPAVQAVAEHDEEQWVEEWVDYTQEELAEMEIAELKKFLADTDYVVLKIQEAIIDNDTLLLEELKTTYSEVLFQRKAARTRINNLMS